MKKVMFYLFAALALLLLVWAVLAALTPKVYYQTSIGIGKPVEAVYRFLSDYQTAPQWITGLKRVEAISGVPAQAGFRSKYTFDEGGREVIFEEEVLAVEPGRSFQFVLNGPGVTMRTEMMLESLGDSTLLKMDNEVTPTSFMMRAMSPFFKGMTRSRQEADLQRLKQLLEGLN
jgi:uncharacterized membrane protein